MFNTLPEPQLLNTSVSSATEQNEQSEANHPMNRAFSTDPAFKGPTTTRKKTNVSSLCLFAIVNLLVIVYGVCVWGEGDPEKLFKLADYQGEYCGSGALSNKPYYYFLNPSIDINLGICVESCPSKGGVPICLENEKPQLNKSLCYPEIKTMPFGSYCIPQEPITQDLVENLLWTRTNSLKRMAMTIYQSKEIIIFGTIIGLLVTLVMVKNLRKEDNINNLVWISVWGTFVSLIFMGYFAYREYKNTMDVRCVVVDAHNNCGGIKAFICWVLSIIFFAAAIAYAIFIKRKADKVELGISTIKVLAKCDITQYLSTIPWALAGTLSIIAGVLGLIAIHGFSVGQFQTVMSKTSVEGGFVTVLTFDLLPRILVVIVMFSLRWWSNIIRTFGDALTSYVITIWYFKRKRENIELPIKELAKELFSNHFGTISLLAITKILVRGINRIVERSMKYKIKKKDGREVDLCCNCALYLYKNYTRYIDSQLLVHMCLWSSDLKHSAEKAYFLLQRHKTKTEGMNTLITTTLIPIKVCCGMVGAVIVYFYVWTVSPQLIETPVIPAGIAFISGVFISTLFLDFYEMGIKSLQQCYFLDEEILGSARRYTPSYIQGFMEYYENAVFRDKDSNASLPNPRPANNDFEVYQFKALKSEER